MLVMWLWGLVFVVAMSSVSSQLRPRFRDKRLGHLRRARPTSVSAKDSLLHVNRFPLNKHGRHENTMIRRTPSVYFVPDDNIVDIVNSKQGKIYNAKPEIQTIQLVFDDGDSSDADRSLENAKKGSPITSNDIQRLITQLATHHDHVKDLVREKHQKIIKVSPKVNNIELDDSNIDDIEAVIQKALGKPERDRKFKKIRATPSNVVEDMQITALKEILGKVMSAGNVKPKPNVLDNWDRNSLYIAGEGKGKRERANSYPYNSEGMLYITKPKENKGPNLSALLDKVANFQRTGPGRSHASMTEDFNPDEVKRIERITRAIDNDDRTFEQLDKSIERLDQQIEMDDLAELQKFKDITAVKSVRSKDPESDNIGNIADLLRTDRDDKDPLFEFDTLVAK